MKYGKLPSLTFVRSLLKRLANAHGISKQFNNTWRHSTVEWKFAEKIMRIAQRNGCHVNNRFLQIAFYVHDTGRMTTGSKASKILRPAIFHFYAGYDIWTALDFPALARICVVHAGGAGLDKNTNRRNGFLNKNFFPETTEEKIVSYVDCRSDYSTRKGPYIGSFAEAFKRFCHYPGAAARLKKLQAYISKITNGAMT